MAAYVNQSGGTLILPDGTEIKAGESAEVSEDHASNVGVSQWIKAGWLAWDDADQIDVSTIGDPKPVLISASKPKPKPKPKAKRQ